MSGGDGRERAGLHRSVSRGVAMVGVTIVALVLLLMDGADDDGIDANERLATRWCAEEGMRMSSSNEFILFGLPLFDGWFMTRFMISALA